VRILDLFCGAGGAAKGYHWAGFEVVGVDLIDQPRYPFSFHQGNALDHHHWINKLGPFDAIHASPPCQAYSSLRKSSPTKEYPDLIGSTREFLKSIGLPYIIENVRASDLVSPIKLCGSQFQLGVVSGDGIAFERIYRQLRRHRYFETNWPLEALSCAHTAPSIGVHGGGPTKRTKGGPRGGYQGTMEERRIAMGIDWMNRDEINQAIPPRYTLHVGKKLLSQLQA
jgi:DNA (cytosine-5)-methyltransferase 1